jgi:hypothetical protein
MGFGEAAPAADDVSGDLGYDRSELAALRGEKVI